MAVAQFAATALAKNVDNETAIKELAKLQTTLFTLQHQQVFQLQLIQQLQSKLGHKQLNGDIILNENESPLNDMSNGKSTPDTTLNEVLKTKVVLTNGGVDDTPAEVNTIDKVSNM